MAGPRLCPRPRCDWRSRGSGPRRPGGRPLEIALPSLHRGESEQRLVGDVFGPVPAGRERLAERLSGLVEIVIEEAGKPLIGSDGEERGRIPERAGEFQALLQPTECIVIAALDGRRVADVSADPHQPDEVTYSAEMGDRGGGAWREVVIPRRDKRANREREGDDPFVASTLRGLGGLGGECLGLVEATASCFVPC